MLCAVLQTDVGRDRQLEDSALEMVKAAALVRGVFMLAVRTMSVSVTGRRFVASVLKVARLPSCEAVQKPLQSAHAVTEGQHLVSETAFDVSVLAVIGGTSTGRDPNQPCERPRRVPLRDGRAGPSRTRRALGRRRMNGARRRFVKGSARQIPRPACRAENSSMRFQTPVNLVRAVGAMRSAGNSVVANDFAAGASRDGAEDAKINALR